MRSGEWDEAVELAEMSVRSTSSLRLLLLLTCKEVLTSTVVSDGRQKITKTDAKKVRLRRRRPLFDIPFFLLLKLSPPCSSPVSSHRSTTSSPRKRCAPSRTFSSFSLPSHLYIDLALSLPPRSSHPSSPHHFSLTLNHHRPPSPFVAHLSPTLTAQLPPLHPQVQPLRPQLWRANEALRRKRRREFGAEVAWGSWGA